jgi:mannose-6-phosphate isomerase-like protein (cupin superfamily)
LSPVQLVAQKTPHRPTATHSAVSPRPDPSPKACLVMIEKINLSEKLARFEERWAPRVVAELNGQHVKLAKLQGEFVWHHHDHEDELFLVLHGRLRMQLRDRELVLDPGECIVVPRGVEHRPVADEEVHVLLFEPASTVNTGNVRSERTREGLERL